MHTPLHTSPDLIHIATHTYTQVYTHTAPDHTHTLCLIGLGVFF